MRTPMDIGARSTSVPPNNARRACSGRSEVLHDSDDDAALIKAVRDGDPIAFGALYERHVASVRHLAYRLCTNSIDVDDVVSEVFANTLRAIKAGRGPDDDLHSYVLTTTRHTVIKFATRAD